MNELSLFSGCGIGSWAFRNAYDWRTVGYVEWEPYCQQVIAQRIKDGFLDEAPIFGDIRTFNAEFAASYRGVVDVVTGGFPCQPHSVSGQRAGSADERDMWPALCDTLRLVAPRCFFGENVRGLLSSESGGYFGRILGDLADLGYYTRWGVLSAADVGAQHKRERLWIVAHAKSRKSGIASERQGGANLE